MSDDEGKILPGPDNPLALMYERLLQLLLDQGFTVTEAPPQEGYVATFIPARRKQTEHDGTDGERQPD